MDQQYDLFETLPDGCKLWRMSIKGRDAALGKLKDLARESTKSYVVLHLPTREVLGSTEQLKSALAKGA